MPARKQRKPRNRIVLRFAAKAGVSAALVMLGCNNVQNAAANGDTRTISFHHLHTGEDLTVTYKKNGRYDEDALRKINTIMRDWRRNEETAMDPRLIDLVWEVRRDVGARDATVQIVCGYRSPGTNEMLRRRSRHSGVARFSQHMQGKAMDFYIPGAPLDELRAAGLRLQRGGVGFYPTSGSPFVHLDVGSVRHWPRMTHDQLVKIFPDGRTVHIPSDGKPLAGYALALADIQKRGGETAVASAERDDTAPRRSIFAKLFGLGRDEDEDRDTAREQVVAAAAPARVATTTIRSAPAEAQKPMAASLIPLPKNRAAPAQLAAAPKAPATGTYVVANAPRPPADIPPAAAEAVPDNIFDARGIWRGTPETGGRIELASSESSTGSIGPWPAPPERMMTPGEAAIGYAMPNEPKIGRQAPTGALVPRSADAETIAVKGAISTSAAAAGAAVPAPLHPLASRRIDDPWLRAVVMTPSVWGQLTATVIGPLDMRTLAPLMQRPNDAVAMTFSDDPFGGMRADRFGGSAVVFVATTSFTGRTAALQ
ncbi:MAG TPA: DUF882 domain-containing protein [Pseudorhodoplanes sp.]|nr:DUF882 domain-containing protein [Pseudorhodoplanes sp.]